MLKIISVKSSYANYFLNKIFCLMKGNNTANYWDARFKSNREVCDGRLQTALFAVAFVLLEEKLEVSSILDYGCGCGDSLPILKMKYSKSDLFYYDFSKEAMAKAKLNYGTIAKPLEMPTDKTFDLVYCSNVIEHVPDAITFCRSLINLSNKYVVIQSPYNELHDDGTIITSKNKYDEHVRTVTDNIFDDLNSLVEWKIRLTTVPYAWVRGHQIFFIGTKK